MGLLLPHRNLTACSCCHDVPLKVASFEHLGSKLANPRTLLEAMTTAMFEELCSLIVSIPTSPLDSIRNPLELRIWGFAVQCSNMHKQHVQNGNQPNSTFLFPRLQKAFSLNKLGLRATCWFVRRRPASMESQ